MYAHAKGFVNVEFVDVDAAGNLRASGQCRYMDVGKSGVAAVRHGAFAMEACRTPVQIFLDHPTTTWPRTG